MILLMVKFKIVAAAPLRFLLEQNRTYQKEQNWAESIISSLLYSKE